jgi:hypothetical protein
MRQVSDNPDATNASAMLSKIRQELRTIHIPTNSSHRDLVDSVANGD